MYIHNKHILINSKKKEKKKKKETALIVAKIQTPKGLIRAIFAWQAK